MPLLVEDGTGVTGANALATLAQARDFATLRGVTLPVVGAGDAALTAMLVKGTDYLKAFLFVGTQAYPGRNYLPWPRTGFTLDGVVAVGTEVPIDIVNAVCQLCIEQQNGIVLQAAGTGPAVKREKVGPIETEYASPTGASNASKASMPAVTAYLKPYLVALGLRVGRA